MNKVLVNLFVPSINENFEMLILENKKLSEIKKLMIEGIISLTNGDFIDDDKYSLYNQETSVLYNLEYTVKENSIIDGTKLILFWLVSYVNKCKKQLYYLIWCINCVIIKIGMG